jgi:hypothetical protein
LAVSREERRRVLGWARTGLEVQEQGRSAELADAEARLRGTPDLLERWPRAVAKPPLVSQRRITNQRPRPAGEPLSPSSKGGSRTGVPQEVNMR